MILCDTGPIVAAALVGDDRHHECVELFKGLHLAGRRLLVPGTVAAEVGYLLARESGARSESLLLTALADGDFEPVDLRSEDYRRAAQLVTIYGDLPLGTTDATVSRWRNVWAWVRSPRWIAGTSPLSVRHMCLR